MKCLLILGALFCMASSAPPVTNRTGRKAELMKQQFFELCPIARSKQFPIEICMESMFAEPMYVDVNVILHRVIEVNDIKQSMTTFMEAWLMWNISCPNGTAETLAANAGIGENATSLVAFKLNTTEVWYPAVAHMNAAYEPYPMRRFEPGIFLIPLVTPAYFFAGTFMTVESICDDFSFAKFPFDKLTCDIALEIQEPENYVKAQRVIVDDDPGSDMLGDTDIWRQIAPLEISMKSVLRSDFATYSQIRTTIKLERKYNYYIGNTFLPIVTLFVLQVMGLFIEPVAPDRPMFAMTVVLAFAVILALIFQGLPTTSETVYIVQIVIAKMVVCVVLTIYALVTSTLAEHDWACREVVIRGKLQISVMRLMDLAMGLISFFSVFVVFMFYFSKMIS